MSAAKELLEQYSPLFHAKTVDLNDMAGWYNRAREFLQRVDASDEVGELIDLAYMVGRGERELIQRCGEFARALKIRDRIRVGRIRNDLGDATPEVQAEAARKAYQFKADGIRNFVTRVAKEYDKTPRTISNWMKRYPPATRK